MGLTRRLASKKTSPRWKTTSAPVWVFLVRKLPRGFAPSPPTIPSRAHARANSNSAVRRKIVYAQRADADLARLEEFIANESRRQASRAIERILRGLRNLEHFPEMGRDVGEGYRELVLRHGRSGYVIRYRVLDDAI